MWTVRARDRIELLEEFLLNGDVLDDGLDDEVGTAVRGDSLLSVSGSRDAWESILFELFGFLLTNENPSGNIINIYLKINEYYNCV